MIPDSFLARNGIYTIAVLQTAVAPLAFVYYVHYLVVEQPLFSTNIAMIDSAMYYYFAFELLFYVFFQITRNRMQYTLPPVHPNAKERRTLYYNCITNIRNVEEWLTGWFMRAHDPSQHPSIHEICRENLAEWIAWAFFAKPLETVLEDETATEELYWMIDHFAAKFMLDIKPGYDEDIVAFRLTLDPVQAYHRPLAFYVFIMSMTYITSLILKAWGLRRFGPDIQSSLSLWWSDSHQQQQPNDSNVQSESIVYWFKDGDRSKKPIIFIHGIGPGFLPYIKFVHNLLHLGAPVFCVEQPHVAMRCIEQVPTMQDTVRDIERMLHHHGFHDAVFVAHSLGTGVVSWAVQHIPKSVAAMVLLDPICFMLHYKDICVNFVYRIPKTASESIVKFFASTELYISYFISRHFHWFQMALFATPSHTLDKNQMFGTTLLPRATKVFLSENDNIVNSERVDEYLCDNGIESTVMKGLDHGWFLFKTEWQKEIIDAVARYSLGEL